MNENTTLRTGNLETISARELRQILFYITDQEMTVEQLRAKLFAVENQDDQKAIGFSMESALSLR